MLDYIQAALANYRLKNGNIIKVLEYFTAIPVEINFETDSYKSGELQLSSKDYYDLSMLSLRQDNLEFTKKCMGVAINSEEPLSAKEYRELSEACFRVGLNELAIEASIKFAEMYSKKLENLPLRHLPYTLQEIGQEFSASGKGLESYVGILDTFEAHKAALENAFIQARKEILITNYGTFYKFDQTNLFKEILPFVDPKVKITFKYNHKPEHYLPNIVEENFHLWGIDFAKIDIHAKIVMVDNWLVMIGSFNWFTQLNWPEDYNRTLVCSGGAASTFTKLIRDTIYSYQARKDGGPKDTAPIDTLIEKPLVYSLSDGSELTYLSTPKDHRLLLSRICHKVENRIIILSPFVTDNTQPIPKKALKHGDSPLRIDHTYAKDFDSIFKNWVLSKSIMVCFVILPENYPLLTSYLEKLKIAANHPLVKIIKYKDLHAKTLIMDRKLMAEGSFNWLCADRNQTSAVSKLEATFVYKGPAAETLIDKFYQGPVGMAIEEEISSQRERDIVKDDWANSNVWKEVNKGELWQGQERNHPKMAKIVKISNCQYSLSIEKNNTARSKRINEKQDIRDRFSSLRDAKYRAYEELHK